MAIKLLPIIRFRQRVYGVTWAIVRVGYAYSNCEQIIWDTQSTQVSGHDMSVSDIGGWDLSIHHRYNFHEGKEGNLISFRSKNARAPRFKLHQITILSYFVTLKGYVAGL